jgi:hypothetical protein
MWDRNSLARSVLGRPAGPGAGAHPWADGGRVLQSPSRGDDSRDRLLGVAANADQGNTRDKWGMKHAIRRAALFVFR